MSTRALIFVLVSISGGAAHAGPWLQACEQSIQSSQQKCEQAYQSYKASDAARLANGVATSTNDAHNNAINLKGKIDSAKAELDKDIAQCQAAQRECESTCDQKQKEASSQPPQNTTAKQDAGQIPGKKAGECTGKIQPKTAEMQAGRAPLDNQSQQADKTRDQSQSGGGAPQSPQSGSGKDSADAGTAAAATPGTGALNCAVAGGSRFSDCNATFVTKCTSSMTSTECDAFSDRYCNLASGGEAPAVAQATTNLVIDKRGEGLGSSYCGYANAYRYCQTPGRESCPSCLRVYQQSSCVGFSCLAQTSPALTSAQRTSCPDDPSLLAGLSDLGSSPANLAAAAELSGGGAGETSPLLAASVGSSSGALTTSGFVATGGVAGAAGASGGVGATTGAAGGGGGSAANREGVTAGVIGSGAVGGTGDAGAPWIAGGERDLAATDVRAAFEARANDPAAAVTGLSPDVSTAYGPSVFSLGSRAIHGFCVRQRVASCN